MRKITLLLSMLVLSVLAFAQRTVTGTVRDDKGNPIPFATVTEVGKKNAVTADANGVFSIKAADGASLQITASGHEAQTVAVSGNTVTATLTATNQQLSEVVVTALGIQRQRKELGYSTARVNNEQLTQASPVNVANGLQGKVSGLNITTVNNGVFEDVKINLRGIRSLTGNNNPMLLLDGVPLGIGYLSSLNPNDIADVTVLKGASAAAIYGPDAVNGAIVVTTRKGTRAAPVITVSNTTQLSKISFFPKFQSEFGSGGYGDYTPYENWSWGPAFDGSMKPIGHTLANGKEQIVPYRALPNERKNFFNTGVTVQNDVSFAAKDFYISLQDVKLNGIVPDDENRRTGIRLNTSREYGKFSLGFNINYIQQNYNVFNDAAMDAYNRGQNVGLNGGLLNLIFNTPAHIPITSYKDFKNNEFAQYNNYFNDYGHNPYFALDNWRSKGKNDDLLTNLDLSFKAFDFLTFTYRAAAAVTSTTTTATSNGEKINSFGSGRGFVDIPGAVSEGSGRSSRISSDFFVNFNKRFNDFRVNAIVGNYVRQVDVRNTSVGAGNLVVPELFNVSNRTGELSGSSSISRSRLLSGYGSVGVSYKTWLNLEVTGRNDWTSILSTNNNSYFYPGASLSFVASDVLEPLRNSNTISYLKLRGSWNKTGNANIGVYSLAATYAQASGFPYGSLPGFTASNTAYDPEIQPEFVESKEFGVELGLLKNRLNFEATYFHQDNTNQIIPIRVSSATGYTNSYVNAASFVNKGVEIDMRLTPLVKLGQANISFRANATYNTSQVLSVYEGLDQLFAGGYDNFAANYAVKGSPAFVFLATDYLRDDQGRVIVDRITGYPSADPNVKQFGRTMPLWVVGLNPSFDWKGLNLSVVAEYRGGHYAYHGIGPDMAWTGVSAATAVNHRERFVFPNSVYDDGSGKYVPNTSVAVSNVNDFFTGVYRDVASNFITSAASWRIREVSLGYNIPVKILGNQNVIKGLGITLNARNLALWLPKENEYTDPDFNFTTTNSSGVNTSQINPPTRIFGANLTVTF